MVTIWRENLSKNLTLNQYSNNLTLADYNYINYNI